MSNFIWLSKAEIRRSDPYFPLSHGLARVDDLRALSGNRRGIPNRGGSVCLNSFLICDK